MRTLVIGIPLPNASFDNYSIASAPSISEYGRLVVEISSVWRVVTEIAEGKAEHRTAGGELVVNRPATGNEFALAELLTMRRREAAQFFARGGAAVCYAYPEMRVRGITGIAEWRSYEWLPEPRKFSWSASLLPGFGKERAEAIGALHPFAGYVEEFAGASRYRVYAEDETISTAGGTVLARSAGDFAVAFELRVGEGRIVLTPPLLDPAKDRQRLADAILAGFEGVGGASKGLVGVEADQTLEGAR
jgi:hypothetical protein